MNETFNYSKDSGLPLATVLNLHMNEFVGHVVNNSWEKINLPLADWHKNQLKDLPVSGIRCLLRTWFVNQLELVPGK